MEKTDGWKLSCMKYRQSRTRMAATSVSSGMTLANRTSPDWSHARAPVHNATVTAVWFGARWVETRFAWKR